MKAVTATLSIVLLVFAIAVSTVLGVTSYQLNRDINGWKTRAQVSSEPNDMYDYMSKVKSGMESWGMTSGYAAIIFKTPDNDMSLIYRAVGQHVDQALVLTKMDHSSPEYQTGLDNLRGSIREIDLHTWAYYAAHDGLIWSILCWITWILFLVFGLWWFILFLEY